ncbi:FCD domain-containing protein [Mesorhizobium sp. SB112]|uniref:FCD domain-containing protein n=1 Tax=Mesorhizobium sp. SB112 TaxID=3151853 RepID=UPI003266FAFC
MTEIFSKIDHSRTADEVVRQIESLILEGVLRVSDRLPGERELARQFDVSRPILREALKALELRGLLVTRHGGGTYVADVIGQIFSKPVIELIASHNKASADYLEYRREIEGVAAEYAAKRATSEDREMLSRIMARMEETHRLEDVDQDAAIDLEFHNAVGECAHNIILLHTLRACYRLLSEDVFHNRQLAFALPGARDKLLVQHQAIHAAIIEGDAPRARQAAMDHISFVERAMAEAERTGDWQRVSRLRLRQRVDELPKKNRQ